MGLYYRYAVIFQVIIDIYWSDSEILCRRLMYSLLEVSIKPQHLMKKKIVKNIYLKNEKLKVERYDILIVKIIQ